MPSNAALLVVCCLQRTKTGEPVVNDVRPCCIHAQHPVRFTPHLQRTKSGEPVFKDGNPVELTSHTLNPGALIG